MFNIPRRFAGIKRFDHIIGTLSYHGYNHLLERVGLKKKSFFSKKDVSRPIELRILFEELGGSFIKMGQFLSLRPDLIPKEYCDELSKLQDRVEGFSYEEVKHAFEFETKKKLTSVFKKFDKEPLAAASIGQVHVAYLKNGKKVAVKIMRPGVTAVFETDLEIMEYFARLIKSHYDVKVFDPLEIFEEFKRYTENELDFMKEARNIKAFSTAIAKEYDLNVQVPLVYESISTRKILVMQFIEGIGLSKIIHEPGKYKEVDKTQICKDLSNFFLTQIFINGVFHADPHPGNIIYSKNSIGLIDFGIVGRLDPSMKENLAKMLIAILNKDTEGLVDSIFNLNAADDNVCSRKDLREDIIDQLGEFYDVSLQKIDISSIFIRVLNISRNHGIKISKDYVLLAKCLITLKGVCLDLDPKFNIITESRPFVNKLAGKLGPGALFKKMISSSAKFANFLADIPEQSKKLYGVINKADFALDTINVDIRKLTTEIRVESTRLVLGIIIAALIISASFTANVDKNLSNLLIISAAVFLVYILYSIFRESLRNRGM